MYENHKYRLSIIAFLLLPIPFFCAGCANVDLQKSDKITELDSRLALAEDLFISGNFAKALVQYEQVLHNSLSAADKNHALYGLACTRLIMAENGKEVVLAINDLQKWDSNKGTAPFNENQHMLVLALKRKANLMQQQINNNSEGESQKDSLIADQKKKIAQLTSKMEKLQKQLEELEAVEENFQGKRKAL